MVDFDARTGQPHGRTFANDISEGMRKGKYMLIERPSTFPIVLQNGTSAAPVSVPTLPSGVADAVATITFGQALGHQSLEEHSVTAQALSPLLHATKGLEIALDQVDNETVEYVPGGNKASNPLLYLAGTDPGVFIKATFEITAANGMDQFGVGFRKQEAYQTPTSWLNGGAPVYTDAVLFGFAGIVASPNQVRSSTTIGSVVAVASATNFFWTAGQIHTLEVRVSKRVVSYFINGSRMGEKISKDGLGAAITGQSTTPPPTYTFTTGLSLIPFIFLRQDAATTTVFLRRLEVGQLLEVGLQPEGRGPQAG